VALGGADSKGLVGFGVWVGLLNPLILVDLTEGLGFGDENFWVFPITLGFLGYINSLSDSPALPPQPPPPTPDRRPWDSSRWAAGEFGGAQPMNRGLASETICALFVHRHLHAAGGRYFAPLVLDP
jgi:hypothetical protein